MYRLYGRQFNAPHSCGFELVAETESPQNAKGAIIMREKHLKEFDEYVILNEYNLDKKFYDANGKEKR